MSAQRHPVAGPQSLFDSGPLDPMPVAAPPRAGMWLAKVAAGPVVALGGLVIFAALSVVLLVYPGRTADRLAVFVGPLVPALGAIAVWAVTAAEPGRPGRLRILRWTCRVTLLAGVPAELLRFNAAGAAADAGLQPAAAGGFVAAFALWLLGMAVTLQYLELLARRLDDTPLRWSFAALKFLTAFTLGLFVMTAVTGWGAGAAGAEPADQQAPADPAAARGMLVVVLALCAVLAYLALRLFRRLTAAARQIGEMNGTS